MSRTGWTSVSILGAGIVALLTYACNMNPKNSLAVQVDELLQPYADSTHVAVAVIDPTNGWTFERLATREFHAASTMKVPVLIELFKQAAEGQFQLTDSITVSTEFRSIADGSSFTLDQSTDSDQEMYGWKGKDVAIVDLAHRMINVSSNLATNLLINHVGAENVQMTIEKLGTQRMRVLRGVEDIPAFRLGLNNTATAGDLAILFEALTGGRAVSETSDVMMISILEEQHFNEMIPAGLPDGTRVAHKTGQITNIHHDAGLVFPKNGPAYVLVILTEGFPDDALSNHLGAEIARYVHSAILKNRQG